MRDSHHEGIEAFFGALFAGFESQLGDSTVLTAGPKAACPAEEIPLVVLGVAVALG